MNDPTLPIHKAVRKAKSVEDLDRLVREAADRVKAALLDFGGPGKDWEANAALDNASPQYRRLGMEWWKIPKHLKAVGDEAGIEAAGEARLRDANRRALERAGNGRGR